MLAARSSASVRPTHRPPLKGEAAKPLTDRERVVDLAVLLSDPVVWKRPADVRARLALYDQRPVETEDPSGDTKARLALYDQRPTQPSDSGTVGLDGSGLVAEERPGDRIELFDLQLPSIANDKSE